MKSWFVRLMIASTGAFAGHAALAALPRLPADVRADKGLPFNKIPTGRH